MIPSPSPDPSNEDACRMAAAQLQRDHRNWLVMWGCYTHTYVAFPLFHAPRGTVLTATAPGEMAAKMRRQERSARGHQPGVPQEWQEPAAPPPGGPQSWPGNQSLRPWGPSQKLEYADGAGRRAARAVGQGC